MFDNMIEQVREAAERETEPLQITNLLAEAVESMERINQSSDHTDFEDDSADDFDSGQHERQANGSSSGQQGRQDSVGAEYERGRGEGNFHKRKKRRERSKKDEGWEQWNWTLGNINAGDTRKKT